MAMPQTGSQFDVPPRSSSSMSEEPICPWCGVAVFPEEEVLAIQDASRRWFHTRCARAALACFNRKPEPPRGEVEDG